MVKIAETTTVLKLNQIPSHVMIDTSTPLLDSTFAINLDVVARIYTLHSLQELNPQPWYQASITYYPNYSERPPHILVDILTVLNARQRHHHIFDFDLNNPTSPLRMCLVHLISGYHQNNHQTRHLGGLREQQDFKGRLHNNTIPQYTLQWPLPRQIWVYYKV